MTGFDQVLGHALPGRLAKDCSRSARADAERAVEGAGDVFAAGKPGHGEQVAVAVGGLPSPQRLPEQHALAEGLDPLVARVHLVALICPALALLAGQQAELHARGGGRLENGAWWAGLKLSNPSGLANDKPFARSGKGVSPVRVDAKPRQIVQRQSAVVWCRS